MPDCLSFRSLFGIYIMKLISHRQRAWFFRLRRGKPVINVPNCSNIGGAGWTGCDKLVEGSIEVGVRIAEVLNAHGKVPMFANPGSFVKPEGRKIWLDEKRLVDALKGAAWFT